MALSFNSALRKVAVLPSRVVSLAAANIGLLTLMLVVVCAGVVLFYLVILPPATSVYP